MFPRNVFKLRTNKVIDFFKSFSTSRTLHALKLELSKKMTRRQTKTDRFSQESLPFRFLGEECRIFSKRSRTWKYKLHYLNARTCSWGENFPCGKSGIDWGNKRAFTDMNLNEDEHCYWTFIKFTHANYKMFYGSLKKL